LHSKSPDEAARLAAVLIAEHYQKVQGFQWDPLHNWTHFFLTCGLIVLLVASCIWWRPILNSISEDSVFRCDRFFLYYWTFLQCCGCCDGEWTRCFSRLFCCCFPQLKKRNLKRALAEYLGLAPIAIRAQDIVLGGLPRRRNRWFQRAPDVFLQVIADEMQPTLRTEVIPEADINCIQFSTCLTLAIKNNFGEKAVHFSVQETRLVGTSTIADSYVTPMRLISWAKKGERVRIELESREGYEESASPWMFLNLSIPPEVEFLHLEPGSFSPVIAVKESPHQGKTTVREGTKYLAVRTDDDGMQEATHVKDRRQQSCWTRCGCQPAARAASGDNYNHIAMIKAETAFHTPKNDEAFRAEFPLLDERGARMFEPEQIDRREEYRFRARLRFYMFVFAAVTLIYVAMRFVTGTCIEEFSQLRTMELYAEKENVSVTNMSDDLRGRIRKECKMWRSDTMKFAHKASIEKWVMPILDPEKVKTSEDETKELNIVCERNQSKIFAMCDMQSNAVQDIRSLPRAFGLPCISPLCRAGSQLHKWDEWFMLCPVIFFTTVVISRVVVHAAKRSAAVSESVVRVLRTKNGSKA